MGRSSGLYEPPAPRMTAAAMQGQRSDPDQRIYGRNSARVDAAMAPRQGNLFAWPTTASDGSPAPTVVDLDAGEYKDITDGRSAGDPSGGT